jgi:ABC-type sugar transport system substrate-binding protein
MKKLIVIALLIVFVVSAMTACTPAEPVAETKTDKAEVKEEVKEEPAEDTMRIFMSNAYYTAPYCAPLNKGVEDKALELGYEIQIVDGEGSADKQLAQFKAAVSEGYDALMYFPADGASTPPVVEYLNSTGLPWVVLNTRVDASVEDQVPCTVASDEAEIGRNIARMAVDYLGDEGKVVYIEGAAGASYTVNVTKGINEIFADTNIEILNDHQYSDWDPGKSMKLMEDFLTKYGKENIDLVVCQDGGMFQGAIAAIDAIGLKGELMCVAAGNDLIIKESILDGSLLGTSIQDPFIEGALGVTSLDKLIKGEEVEKWAVTPGGLCLIDDVDDHNWF